MPDGVCSVDSTSSSSSSFSDDLVCRDLDAERRLLEAEGRTRADDHVANSRGAVYPNIPPPAGHSSVPVSDRSVDVSSYSVTRLENEYVLLESKYDGGYATAGDTAVFAQVKAELERRGVPLGQAIHGQPARPVSVPRSAAAVTGIHLDANGLAPPLPHTDSADVGNAEHVGPFKLVPQYRTTGDAREVAYFVALRTEKNRSEFIVGPDAVADFKANVRSYDAEGWGFFLEPRTPMRVAQEK